MNASLPAPGDINLSHGVFGDFDYTFTDKELEDVLGFMERQQPHLASTLPTPETVNLRAQPQPYDYGLLHVGGGGFDPGRMSPFLPSDSPGLGVKLELLDSPQQAPQPPGMPHPGAMFSRGHPDSLPPVPPTAHPPRQQQQQQQGGGGGSAAAGGGQSSRGSDARHSTVEKQRRDRINSLIDELRDLVPPQAGCGTGEAAEGSDSRRPKHVVLADTIQLVRDLQEKLVTSEPRPRRQGTSSTSVSAAGAEHDSSALCPPGEFHRELSSNSQRSADSHPDLPQAPDDASPMEEGVVVEAVDDTFYVKVHCKDRAGLLADIVRALKTMPLEITSAAVTTTRHGMVCDVFQVRLERGEAVSLSALRDAVMAVIFDSVAVGEKKRRADQ
ncbi:hypothetical protein APUTEX25_002275 [Auxenochlorella protothecoides]|uniref:BHLH domain-containing protein n=1 Tax=Auxenochlorella protothecoides TaxID=3075 RepID=A0A3M7L2R4_AUXPR|nr:hypothetical protein APUTEX25_002275 [Auxenochlorella protothecoides]|eukprot:RMZ57043.1 hypothetical protein APUTEX25_002275 [Auxenochlorella protothecoides]